MRDGEPEVPPHGGDALAALVDQLGAAATDQVATRAHARVRQAVAAGVRPPGLRHLSDRLTAVEAGRPPPQRPVAGLGSVVAALPDNPLLLIEGAGTEEVAATVAALVDDGRRVVVTAADAVALETLRSAVPAGLDGRVVDALPALVPADLHRLRGLLATSTPARRSRPTQRLPDAASLPDVVEVAELSHRALRSAPPGAEPLDGILSELDTERRAAVTSVARCAHRSLTAVRSHARSWTSPVLDELVHGRQRRAFDGLVQATAQALAVTEEDPRDSEVRRVGPLPRGAADAIGNYLAFLRSGGRQRSVFKSAAQRAAEPVVRMLRVGGAVPETAAQLQSALADLEFAERLAVVQAACAELGVPAPRRPDELAALSAVLVDVAAAARSVSALRHDVLFLHPGSPVAVPDVSAAARVAAVVLDYENHGSGRQAANRLDELADALEALAPPEVTAPEHARVVAALRLRDVAAYAAALDGLAAARWELRDEQRTVALAAELGMPALARAWTSVDGAPVRAGLAWLVPVDRLLDDLPPSDRADVVVVLDAGGLGLDRALLAAAAPRLVAAVTPGAEAGLVDLLRRAGAPVVPAGPPDASVRMVSLPSGTRVIDARGPGGVDGAQQARA
jgi:hypothetical protein